MLGTKQREGTAIEEFPTRGIVKLVELFPSTHDQHQIKPGIVVRTSPRTGGRGGWKLKDEKSKIIRGYNVGGFVLEEKETESQEVGCDIQV